MKFQNTLLSACLILVLAGANARAEEVVKPTPAPAVKDDAERSVIDEPAVIDHVVYLAKLPAPGELIKAAEQKGTPILRIDQTADRILVVYQYEGGRTVTFAYMLLSAAAAPQAARVLPPSSARYTVTEPLPAPPAPVTTTIIYEEPPPPVYYPPRVRYYDPAWDFWGPFSVGVGLGWGFGGHSHHHHGWPHGGHHGWFGGGFHGGRH